MQPALGAELGPGEDHQRVGAEAGVDSEVLLVPELDPRTEGLRRCPDLSQPLMGAALPCIPGIQVLRGLTLRKLCTQWLQLSPSCS